MYSTAKYNSAQPIISIQNTHCKAKPLISCDNNWKLIVDKV